MSQSKIRLLELNAQLAQNLNDKGVEATADIYNALAELGVK